VSYSNFTAADLEPYGREVGGSGTASVSRTLGYIGLLAWIFPVVGFPLALIGLALGVASLRGGDPGKARRAIMLCSVGLLLSVANAIGGIYLYTHGNFATTTASAPAEIINPHCQPQTPASTTGP
jgi:hypothetical protein